MSRLQYLFCRGRPATLSVIGLTLAFALALVSMAIMEGFQKIYRDGVLAFNAHLVILGQEQTEQEQALLETYLERGVSAYSPFAYTEALLILPDELKALVLKGVDMEKLAEVYPLKLEHFESACQQKNIPCVLIGQEIYHQILTVDPHATSLKILIVPDRVQATVQPTVVQMGIGGTFASGLSKFDSQFILAAIADLDGIVGSSQTKSGIEVALHDPMQAESLAGELASLLPPSSQVISWQELNSALFEALKMEKGLFIVIFALVMLIALFNIVGVVFILALQQKNALVLLYVLGAKRSFIRWTLIMQALQIATHAVLWGSLLSVAVLMGLRHWGLVSLDPQIVSFLQAPFVWPWGFWIILIGILYLLCYGLSSVTSKYMVGLNRLQNSFH